MHELVAKRRKGGAGSPKSASMAMIQIEMTVTFLTLMMTLLSTT